MAISWGGWNGRLRVGIEGTFSTSSTSATLTVRYYVQTDGYNYNDTQTLVLSGAVSSSHTFENTLSEPNQMIHVATRTVSHSLSYSGGPTLSFSAKLTEAWNGASPSHTQTYTFPKRPASAPDTPSAPSVSGVDTTRATLSWTAPDGNGASIDNFRLIVRQGTGWGDPIIYDTTQNNRTRSVTNLKPGTEYIAYVAAHNSAGWSDWSAGRTFTTVSGMKVKVNGVWRPAKVWVKVDGVWRPAKPYVRVAGTWRATK